MSTERLIVDQKVADRFLAKLAAKVETLRAGDPQDSDSVLGSLVDVGATLVAGGQLQGSILQPTLLDGVTDRMRLYREESFGPVAVMIRGEGDEALLRLANDSEFGLAAAIFSRDTGRALALAQRVESGICHHQRSDRPRRAAHRRQGLDRAVHPVALGDLAKRPATLPDLIFPALTATSGSQYVIVSELRITITRLQPGAAALIPRRPGVVRRMRA